MRQNLHKHDKIFFFQFLLKFSAFLKQPQSDEMKYEYLLE